MPRETTAASITRNRSFDRKTGVSTMQWEAPSFDDIRFGFEVTMYINNR